MRKVNVFILFILFFLSCSEKIKFTDDKLTFLGKADYLNYEKIFISDEEPFLLLWKDNKILKRSLLSRGNNWQFYTLFKPDNLFIEKYEQVSLTPQSIEDIKYTSDRKYSAFVMRLGNSMNTTIGIADMKLNKVIFSYVLKEHPPVPGRRFEFVAFENVFVNPVFSDDNKFLACDVFNYLNKRLIRIIEISTKKHRDIENAVLPCFVDNKMYFISIDNNTKKTHLSLYDLLTGEKTKIKEMDEYVLLFKKTKGKVFLVTKNNIYYFDYKKTEIIKIMSFNEVKENIKNSEIMRVFIENYNGKEYLFLILKILENNQYVWKLYGKILKI